MLGGTERRKPKGTGERKCEEPLGTGRSGDIHMGSDRCLGLNRDLRHLEGGQEPWGLREPGSSRISCGCRETPEEWTGRGETGGPGFVQGGGWGPTELARGENSTRTSLGHMALPAKAGVCSGSSIPSGDPGDPTWWPHPGGGQRRATGRASDEQESDGEIVRQGGA